MNAFLDFVIITLILKNSQKVKILSLFLCGVAEIVFCYRINLDFTKDRNFETGCSI